MKRQLSKIRVEGMVIHPDGSEEPATVIHEFDTLDGLLKQASRVIFKERGPAKDDSNKTP